jgi:hypothetical protein
MIDITRYETSDAFMLLKQEWNPLLEQSPVDDAFLTWEWLSTWWKHFGKEYDLWLLTARDIGNPPPDVAGFITRNRQSEILASFGDYLVQESSSWDVVALREIPSHLQDVSSFLCRFPGNEFTTFWDSTRHFSVHVEGDWKAYCKSLPKGFRKDMNRQIRRLEERADSRFCRYMGYDAVSDLIRTVFTINEQARFPDLYKSSIEQAFHQELAQKMAEQGWLDISFLWVDNEPAAFVYGFLYKGCMKYWRVGFRTQYQEVAVGKILLWFLLKDCFDRGLQELDFLRGDEDYKKRWNGLVREYIHPFVVRRSLLPLWLFVWLPKIKKQFRVWVSKSHLVQKLVDKYDKWRGNV